MSGANRPLTSDELALARWMLENGGPDAAPFLEQLEAAEVTTERCPCGCASINFKVRGKPSAPPGVHPVADFIYGDEADPKGAFVYESAGILSGLEVLGYGGDAPKTLPRPEELRRWEDSAI